jgi:hypothetical protein
MRLASARLTTACRLAAVIMLRVPISSAGPHGLALTRSDCAAISPAPGSRATATSKAREIIPAFMVISFVLRNICLQHASSMPRRAAAERVSGSHLLER